MLKTSKKKNWLCWRARARVNFSFSSCLRTIVLTFLGWLEQPNSSPGPCQIACVNICMWEPMRSYLYPFPSTGKDKDWLSIFFVLLTFFFRRGLTKGRHRWSIEVHTNGGKQSSSKCDWKKGWSAWRCLWELEDKIRKRLCFPNGTESKNIRKLCAGYLRKAENDAREVGKTLQVFLVQKLGQVRYVVRSELKLVRKVFFVCACLVILLWLLPNITKN